MHLRAQKLIDNYVGGAAIAVLRPATMLLGNLLRRNHELTVGDEVVWVKMLGGGSLVLAMPMLLGFRRAHPKVRMVLITTPPVKPFAELLGVFDEYRVIDPRGGFALLWTSLVALFRTMRADCIVDLEVHSRLTTVFTTLTMARNRVAFWLDDIFWRRGLASHLVFFNRASGSFHFYDRIADLFGVAVASREECQATLLASCGKPSPVTPGREVVIGFACSDLGQERMLTPAQWVTVFRSNLRPPHSRFVFLGGPRDRSQGQAIIDALATEFPGLTFANACGTTTLSESVVQIFGASEFWGIDSGLLHLARIGGLRCVSYWGPTDPATRLRTTWALDEQIHYRKIACSPCVHTSESPPCRGDNRCIKGLLEAPAVSPSNWSPMEFPSPRSTARSRVNAVVTGALRNIGFLTVAVALVYCSIHAFDPPRLNWGDSYSDYNVMTAGRNFQKYGFLKMRLTPVLLDASLVTQADGRLVYTHYPQLPDLMNGALRTVFGLSDLSQFRLVALAFSFAALWFIYGLLRHYWSRDTAQVALALWVVNPLWVQHADYLHHAPYAAFFGFGGLYFLVQYLRDEQRRGYLFASGAFLFLLFLASYDYWFFIPLLYAIAVVGHHRTVNRRVMGILSVPAAFAVAAVLFKFGTNAWALGGVGSLVRDLRFQWMERATSQSIQMSYTSGIWPTIVGRVERCFSLLLFPVSLFWLAVPFMRRRLPALDRHWPNPGWLLIAAVPFLCVFIKLWVLQYYPTMLVLPFYAVACAALIVLLAGSDRRLMRVAGAALFLALLGNSIDEIVRFKKAFFDRNAISTLKAQLDRLSVPGQYVMVNHMWDSAYGYYFDRNTVLLAINPTSRMDEALAYYTDARRSRVAPATGAIFVQHKHLADELYDKGFYYLLAREGMWDEWADPERYRTRIDGVINARDSALVAKVSRLGRRVYDSDFYAIWVIPPHPAGVTVSSGETPVPFHRN